MKEINFLIVYLCFLFKNWGISIKQIKNTAFEIKKTCNYSFNKSKKQVYSIYGIKVIFYFIIT